jgi:hypothetical protein
MVSTRPFSISAISVLILLHGDFHAGAVLRTQGRLLVSNAPASFPADWVRDTAAFGGFTGEVRPGKAPAGNIQAAASVSKASVGSTRLKTQRRRDK